MCPFTSAYKSTFKNQMKMEMKLFSLIFYYLNKCTLCTYMMKKDK